MPTKLLLDTDIGSDIDDAVCLAYLLAQPDCDLLGVTTVTGEPVRRAQMVSALCRIAGKPNIPIFPGAEQPFLVDQKQPRSPQSDALTGRACRKDFPKGEAINFLRWAIRENPGEVVLLAIGPLTNIGLLFTIDPELPSLLSAFVCMGGCCGLVEDGQYKKEWNVECDPHAAAMAFRHPAPVHRAVGWNITHKVKLPADEVRARFQQGLLRPVLDFAEVWFEGQTHLTFHDPLAAVTIFDEQVCAFERGTVTVELASPGQMGVTHWEKKADGPHEVAVSVDVERFFERYFSVF